MRPERRRHADDHDIGRAQPLRLGRRHEPALPQGRRDPRRLDVRERAAPVVQGLHQVRVDVETEHAEAGLGDAEGQGQPDIAQPDDTHHRVAIGQTVQHRFCIDGDRIRGTGLPIKSTQAH